MTKQLVVLLMLALPLAVQAQEPAPAVTWDPATIDPAPVDSEFPPSLAPVTLVRDGIRLGATMYLADGPGPHATVVFLPDVPGYEPNQDLAQAARRAGYNALMLRYAGNWGSGGEFTWTGAVDDAVAAIEFLHSPDAADRYRADAERVHLVGDGFGSWVALQAAAHAPAVGCIGTVGAWNPAVTARQLASGGGAEWRASMLYAAAAGGPIRAADAESLIRSLIDDADQLDLSRAGAGARGRPVMLITSSISEADPAWQTMLVAAAFAGAGAASVERFVLNDDQHFSASRVRVARSLVGWLERNCPAW